MKRKPRFRNRMEKRILRQLGIIPMKEKPIGYITIPPKVPENAHKILYDDKKGGETAK